jgi:hypothetical protein
MSMPIVVEASGVRSEIDKVDHTMDLLAVNAMTILGSKRFVAVQPVLNSSTMTRPVNFLFKVLSLLGSFVRSHVWWLSFPAIMVIMSELVLVVFHVLLVIFFGTHFGGILGSE